MDWSSSIRAIVNDIFSPGFAFNVDKYTGYNSEEIKKEENERLKLTESIKKRSQEKMHKKHVWHSRFGRSNCTATIGGW